MTASVLAKPFDLPRRPFRNRQGGQLYHPRFPPRIPKSLWPNFLESLQVALSLLFSIQRHQRAAQVHEDLRILRRDCQCLAEDFLRGRRLIEREVGKAKLVERAYVLRVDLDGDLNTSNDRPAGLPQTVGRGDVPSQLAIINAFRTSRGLGAVDMSLLNIDPVIDLDLRLTKVISLPHNRRFEIFLEGYNLTNHTTLYGGASAMTSSSFLIRTSALDARQTQWGGRFVF